MSDKPFRVLLDLTDLHFEDFKYVWMNVSPRELKTISDFKQTLLQKINLERKDIRLFVRDGLLLDIETVSVLREDDTVKVQYENEHQSYFGVNNEQEYRKSSRKRHYSDNNVTIQFSQGKRSKTDVDVLDRSSECNNLETSSKKKKKHKKSFNSLVTFQLDEHLNNDDNEKLCDTLNTGNNDANGKFKKKKDKNKSAESSLNENHDEFFSYNVNSSTSVYCLENSSSKKNNNENSTNTTLEKSSLLSPSNLEFCSYDTGSTNTSVQCIENASLAQDSSSKGNDFEQSIEMNTKSNVADEKGIGNSSQKKKRKRYKKRKSTSIEPTNSDVIQSADAANKFVIFSDNLEENVKRKHIIYSLDPCDNSSVINEDEKQNAQNSNETYKVSKSLSKMHAESFKAYPKVSTPAQPNGCDNPSWNFSLMQAKNCIQNNIPQNSEKSDKNPAKEVTCDETIKKVDVSPINPEKNLPAEKEYDSFPSLLCMPKVGMHIAYKALELDENYSPVISDYREGVVTNIDHETEDLYIELSKSLIKPGKSGKFENLKPDEVPLPEVMHYDHLRWSDVISPKQL